MYPGCKLRPVPLYITHMREYRPHEIFPVGEFIHKPRMLLLIRKAEQVIYFIIRKHMQAKCLRCSFNRAGLIVAVGAFPEAGVFI